ncbi:hypothetical protein L7F22_042883 [Adiantum nelumboides]|nr:hypothetical protein [Adiantum nelumboides]
MGQVQLNALKEEVDKLLKAGFIYPVNTADWVSTVLVTPKKDGKWKVCVDYKPLNAAMKRDPYPLPFIDDILDSIADHERYGVCDGFSGYFQLTLAQEDQKKTTFITPWGCFCYRVLPFGFMNGCAWYQKRVNKVFSPFLGKFVKDLIDDFCVYSTRKDHCSKLEVAFKQCDESGGQLNPKKCYLAQPRVKFLGHMISENGIEADPDKVKTLILLPSPKDTKQLATFLQKGLKFFRSDWMKVWEHCVPYRDPATLSRLWRAAVGLQRSHSASEEAKEKHRVGEKLRRQKQALLKEQDDGTTGDLNSGDETCEDTTGAYFHEAFLTDYNSQACSPCAPLDTTTACGPIAAIQNSLTAAPNLPMPTAPCPPAFISEYLQSAQSLRSFDTTSKISRRTGKRYRRSSFQVIKLAPGLPSVNLPRCVRVISQAKYNSQFSALGNRSLSSGQKGASASGSAGCFSPTPMPSPACSTGPSDTPSFHGGEKTVPAKMHPLLMQNTFEMGPLSSSTAKKNSASRTVVPGLPSTHNIPRFRPFLPLSKGKSTVGSMEVLRSAADLHPYLQDDGDRQTQSAVAAEHMMERKGHVVEAPPGSGANTGTSHLSHSHWPFFLSDSVIRPEPRRAVRVQNAHPDRSASASNRNNRSRNAVNGDKGKRGSKACSKDVTGHADMLGPSKQTDKESGNSGEKENVVMEQEELSGSEEETEEVVQFDYEEITDSDNEQLDSRKHAIYPDKGEEGIDFEEEEIGSDDGDP